MLLALLPKGKAALARWLALAVAVAGLALACAGLRPAWGRDALVIVDVPWVPSMGIHYLLAADGISRVLVLLTGPGRCGRRAVQLEHRTAHQRVLRLLSSR